MARKNKEPKADFEMFGLKVIRWVYRNEYEITCPICSAEFNEVFCEKDTRYLVCPRCGAISLHLVQPGGSAGTQGAGISVTFPIGE